MVKTAKQLSIFLDNRPGALARVCAELAKEGVDLNALTISDSIDHAVVRLVVSDARRAVHLLESAGLLVLEKDVVCVDIPNRKGVLARMADRLARANVNIDYAYCTARPGSSTGYLILRTDDQRKTIRLLKRGKG